MLVTNFEVDGLSDDFDGLSVSWAIEPMFLNSWVKAWGFMSRYRIKAFMHVQYNSRVTWVAG